MADLKDAILITRDTVATAAQNTPSHAARLNNLGMQLIDRYQRTGAMADLETAIQRFQDALDATPEDHPDWARRLHSLGAGYGDRYLRTGSMEDLQMAIQRFQDALDATPEDHPDRARRLHGLGTGYGDRYQRTGAMADLETAIQRFQNALAHSQSPPIDRSGPAKKLIKLHAEAAHWSLAHQAASAAVSLVPLLTPRSLSNSDKQHLLTDMVGLASDAAAVALMAEKSPHEAIQLLELGRGVIIGSLDELRTDASDLQQQHPQLAEEYIKLRDQLDAPTGLTHQVDPLTSPTALARQVNRRHDAGQKLEQTIQAIQTLPGFDRFLLAPSEAQLKAAAALGPIVIINVSDYRCDALILEESKLRTLHLPRLHSSDIRARAAALESRLIAAELLEWLWESFIMDILDALGFVESPHGSWPRIWWIPTGLLTKFPLHAAGRHYKGSFESVCDRVMSSYSSSVKAIIHGRKRPHTSTSADLAVLVAMEDTPGNSPLPFATNEVQMLHSLCKSMILNPSQPERRKKDIMSKLLQCKIFHFAGHGYTDDKDPSKSYLLLEDWKDDPFTVADFLAMNLRKHSPFLAYLSACGTGRIKDKRFFDESVHLISASQLAGFRHVIGALWDVNDELCVDMARITYEGIRDGGMTDESVCRGLHKATRTLRDRWLNLRTSSRNASRSITARKVLSAADTTGTADTSSSDSGVDKLPRDVVLCDDEERGRTGLLHWVPYVHFGV